MVDPSRPVAGYPAPPGSSYPSAANGYPYPAAHAVQPPPLNYAYPYNYNQNAARASFVRRVTIAMIAFFIIAASIVFIVWLVLRPHVPEFSVDSVSVSNLNLSSPSSQSVLSGDWSIGFTVYNPNKKMSVSYDDLSADLLYRNAFLSETRIPPFDQATEVRTAVNATFSAKNSYVENWVVTGINGDIGRGTVNFNFRVWVRVGFRSGGWRLRRRLLRALCENVAVGVTSGSGGSGKLVGGPKGCRVSV